MSDLPTIAELVDELTNPIHVRERYEQWHGNNRRIRYHEHNLPSLIDQLEAATIPGEVYVEDNGGHVYRAPGSCPPARLEAINLSLEISVGAADWCWRSRLQLRETTVGNLRALVGTRLDSDRERDLCRALRRWLGIARVITGWERPPWRPEAACPICSTWYTLRVRLAQKTAVCVECGETWDEATIGLLAEHVRALTTPAGRASATGHRSL